MNNDELGRFLGTVLPSNNGHWFFVAIGKGSGAQETRINAGDISSIKHLVAATDTAGGNSYYGTSTYLPPEGGRLRRNRECAVLGRFKALRIDIDCGEGKNYMSLDDAVDAVDAFVASVGLSKPLLVSSGRGLHVYFPFSEAVAFSDWSPLANKLRAAAVSNELRFDDNTTEPERLLRLPTSTNPRSGEVVHVFDWGEAVGIEVLHSILAPFAVANKPLVLANADMGNELEANVLQPYSAALAITTCPALAAIKANGGKDVSEPLWKGVLDLIVGGNDTNVEKWGAAVAVSNGHQTFSESELESKLRQSIRQQYSPPTCARVARPECSSCPFAHRVSSPATLGIAGFVNILPAQAPPVTPPPVHAAKPLSQAGPGLDLTTVPKIALLGRYEIREGWMFGLAKNKEGVDLWRPLCPSYRLLRAYRSNNYRKNESGMILEMEAVDEATRQRRSVFSLSLASANFATKDAFLKVTCTAGMYANANERDKVWELMLGFIQLLQGKGIEHEKFDAIGWHGAETFIFGDCAVNKAGAVSIHDSPVGPTRTVDGMDRAVYETAGTIDAQLGALNSMLVTDAAHLVLALGIATPLMRHTAFNGAMVSMYSKASGVGKTALLRAVTSIWGDPTTAPIPPSSTQAAVQHLIGVARSVPVAIDEISMFPDEYIAELLYSVSQGQGKRRMGKGGEAIQAQQAEWQTLVFVTTNTTVAERARSVMPDSNAVLARLLEINMPPLPPEVLTGTPDVVLQRNFGHLGRRVVVALMQHTGDEWRATIEKRVQLWGSRLNTQAIHGTDRFRVALCAIAEIGALIGQGLGLQLDVGAVERVVRESCQNMQDDSSALTISNETLVSQYIADNVGRIGRITDTGKVMGMSEGTRDASYGEIILKVDQSTLRMRVVKCRVPLHRLLDFVKQKKCNVTEFRTWLKSSNTARAEGLRQFMDGTAMAYRVESVIINPAVFGSATLSAVTSVDEEPMAVVK